MISKMPGYQPTPAFVSDMAKQLRASSASLRRKMEVRGQPKVSYEDLMEVVYLLDEAADLFETVEYSNAKDQNPNG
jgi:hypothetical protein